MLVDRATRGLLWKETRQLVPLIGIIVAVGVLLIFVSLVTGSLSREYAKLGSVVPWALPACYAAGVAALLVGLEKEQKTLRWLGSLPIDPTRLIGAKFLAALAGLLAMWLIAGLMIFVSGIGFRGSFSETSSSSLDVSGPTFVLQSFLVLVCGFYTAWRMKSTFAGLLLLVPLVCAPFVIQQLYYSVRNSITGERRVPTEWSDPVLYSVTIVWIAVVAWLAIRAAKMQLAPMRSLSSDELDSRNRLDAWRPTVAPAPSEPFRRSISSFAWQSIHSQRWTLMSMLGVLLLGVLGFSLLGGSAFQNFHSPAAEGWCIFGTLAAALTISWLGVMAFSGDGSAVRLRFLADRGVSPGQAWIGRHVVGISLLSVSIVAYFFCSWWVLANSEPYNTVLSVALVAAGAWTIYSISQWVSQSIPILAGSVVVAPIISAVALVWAGYASAMLEAPLWWLLLLSLPPVVGTRLLMHRFMDGQRGWISIATVVCIALLLAIGPAVPFAVNIARTPDIPNKLKVLLLAEAEKITPVSVSYVRHAWEPSVDSVSMEFMSGEELLQFHQSSDRSPLANFAWPRRDSNGSNALSMDPYLLGSILQSATYTRVVFESSPTDQTATELRVWIDAISELAERVRLSPRLADQNSADRLEIWLVDTLQSESIQSRSDIKFDKAIDIFENSAHRNKSRRQAVLASWLATQSWNWTDDNLPTLGGVVTTQSYIYQFPIKRLLTYDRHTNRVVAALIGMIEAGERGASTSRQRDELRLLVDEVDWDMNWGTYTDQFREHVTLVDLFRNNFQDSIGSLWFAPWEDQARELASKLKNRASVSEEKSQE